MSANPPFRSCSRFRLGLMSTILILFRCVSIARAGTPSLLFARGYTVIPEPQQLDLDGPDFVFGNGWKLLTGSGVQRNATAVEVLREELASRHGIELNVALDADSHAKTIRMVISPGSVNIGVSRDRDKERLAEEAYHLDISPSAISIPANVEPGLLYGTETLVQIVKSHQGASWLPKGRITDWPDLQNRFMYWDDKADLDHPEVLQEMLRQAAFFKFNGVLLKLNAHFEYASAPAVVEPYALNATQLQELTSYGLRYHIQLIPYIDGRAHIAWILKHPEYAKLRAFSESNYELCTTNAKSYDLLEGMYQEVMNATRGVKYFLLSTDERYSVGLANNGRAMRWTLPLKRAVRVNCSRSLSRRQQVISMIMVGL